MKKTFSLIASIAVCSASRAPVASIVATSAALTACKSTQATAYKTISTVQTSVEVALAAWKDYVARRKAFIASNPDDSLQSAATIALANRELKARAALEAYKVAAIAAVKLARSTEAPAPASLVTAASTFIAATQP